MNRQIGRPASALGSEKRVPTKVTGRNWLAGSWFALLCAVAGNVLAQDSADPPAIPTPATLPTQSAEAGIQSDPQFDLKTVIEPKYEMDPTSLSPLGDDFNPVNGSVTFSATDISVPGNFAIPVALRRWVPSDDADTGGPGNWKWNIPFIRGNFLDVRPGHSSTGWQWGGTNTWRNGKNCTGSADTVIDEHGAPIQPSSYWQGKLLHIPGVTSETFLTTSSGEQVTKSHFKIECDPTEENAAQQSIVVRGPDGTKYTFNEIKTYFNGKNTLKGPIVLTRLLMISKVEDRFGNYVDYSYEAGKLTRIKASDEREITITYQNGEVYQATAHGRTWTYETNRETHPDGQTSIKGTTVTLPDGRKWEYEGLSALAFMPNGIPAGYNQIIRLGETPRLLPGCTTAATSYAVKIISPDGLQNNYTFEDILHNRSDVEPDIYTDLYDPGNKRTRALHCTVKRSLSAKTSSGAGVGPYAWTYKYSGNEGTYKQGTIFEGLYEGIKELPVPLGEYPAPIVAGGGAVHYRSVTVTGSDKQSVFYIDRRSDSISEERVVAQDTRNVKGDQLLERSEFSFKQGAKVADQHWYMCPCEGVSLPVNESQLVYHVNQTQERRIRYVDNKVSATFTTTYPEGDFDERGRPKTIIRSGIGGALARTERVIYDLDNTNLGVIGQVKSISVDGITQPMEEHTYDPSTAQRTSTKKFGVLQANYQYDTDGTLSKHIDGLGQATLYKYYRRGQPQRIERADTTFETASIDDWGLVTGRTDPNGHSWSYDYDNALRLKTINPPANSPAEWIHTTIAYEQAAVSEFGLPIDHWRQTVDKGSARTVTYFDALWRPRMVRSYDTGNEATTRKVVVKTFDVGGRLEFESYPQRDLGTVAITSPGRRMQYDPLGRLTFLKTDNETGEQTTKTEYLDGFKVRVTNPRGKITTQSLWAQDDPDRAQLAEVTAPEGVFFKITRNVLGNPTSIRRWGTPNEVSADVTRSYVYDSGQRLCKTLEPEVIATVQGYDAAGNVIWRAPGVNLAGNNCETGASVPAAKKISYAYDSVNQLKTVTYGDGSP